MKRDAKSVKEGTFRMFLRLVPMVVMVVPWLFFSQLTIDLFSGLLTGFVPIFQQRFFDKAAEVVANSGIIWETMPEFAMLGGVYTLQLIVSGVTLAMHWCWRRRVECSLTNRIHEKIRRINPLEFENTEHLDSINKAEQGVRTIDNFVHTALSLACGFIVYFAVVSVYLFTLKPILAISIVIIFIPSLFIQLIRAKVFSKVEDASAPLRRESDYYDECMTSREYFKETRLLGGFRFFMRLFRGTLDNLMQIRYKANVRTNLYELAMRIMTVAGYCVILLMLFEALMDRTITVGAFAAVFAALGNLYDKMEELVCRHFGRMARAAGTVRNYLQFLDLPERGGENLPVPAGCDISVKNVSFSYPNAETAALRNATLTIKNGETIAIVGENGSGKSTLIRLLCGIYLPREGEILYGDVDTRDISLSALNAETSAVFQKYQRYQMTLRENIGISHPDAEPEDEILDRVTEMAGVDRDSGDFPNGYETMLSREFDGVDLSGGQWQRVAIARGFFRSHAMIILDEPTAAIDPFEETRIYNRFAEISRDKTAVIVTHRLGSVRLADRIVVLRDGEIVQVGTHDELIASEGEYVRLYRSQEQWYQQEEAAE